MTASERVAARASALKFWLRRSPELRTVETEIHAKLDSGVEEVVRGKRIALWKEMLESIGYSDLGVVDKFCGGATLTGPTCPTGLWPKQFTPATLTEEELQQQATVQRRHLTYSQVVFFGEEIARSVWKQTLDEVAKGELEGPLALDPADRAAQQAFWCGARWESPLCGRYFSFWSECGSPAAGKPKATHFGRGCGNDLHRYEN